MQGLLTSTWRVIDATLSAEEGTARQAISEMKTNRGC